jgi:hypothetical protein
MLCEKNMIIAEARSALLIPHNTKLVALSNVKKTDKHYTNCRMTNHNVETC